MQPSHKGNVDVLENEHHVWHQHQILSDSSKSLPFNLMMQKNKLRIFIFQKLIHSTQGASTLWQGQVLCGIHSGSGQKWPQIVIFIFTF